jgi:hypothetical protein
MQPARFHINKASPNPAAALDGGIPLLWLSLARWPAASEPRCWALLPALLRYENREKWLAFMPRPAQTFFQ